MDKDFMQYVYSRIEKTLTGNAKYMELQSACVKAAKNDAKLHEELTSELEALEQELCYIQGYKDAMRMVLDIN